MKAWIQSHPLTALLLTSAVLFGLVAGVLYGNTPAPQNRTMTLTAQRFRYTPHIIEVNRGDRVTLRLLSTDVHHGFYLDGYERETSARPGLDGTVTFVANRSGRYAFRCSMTCGPFHPYMIGYLRVKPDLRLLGSMWVFGTLLAVALVMTKRITAPPFAPDVPLDSLRRSEATATSDNGKPSSEETHET